MSITIESINTAIAEAFDTVSGIVRVEDGSQIAESAGGISEGIHSMPLAQVYWDEGNSDASNAIHQTTFQAGVIQTDLTYLIDIYVTQRLTVGQSMALLLPVASRTFDMLHGIARTGVPYFGLEGLQAFSFRAKRVSIEYSEALYDGVRFTISVRIY